MNKVFFILALTIFSTTIYSQDFNTKIIDDESGKPMLIGYCTREAFEDTSLSWWWNSAYNLYDVDTLRAKKIKEGISDVKIKIIMGTWCSDSQREVPRFYKILDEIEYPTDEIILIGVNKDKVSLEDEVEGLEIDFVPTFIFYRNNEEIGRIVESPLESLEKDLLGIIQN